MHDFVSTPGQIYYTEYGSGPPMLLLHGLMITGEMFRPVIDHFSKKYRLIIPDLRGHGKSGNLPPPYTAEQMAKDVLDLLNSLAINSTIIVGYSHGGAIAQQIVLENPTICSRLILASTYAHNAYTLREKFEDQVAPLLIKTLGMKRFTRFILSQGLKQLDKEKADWVINLISSQDEKSMIQVWKDTIAFDSRSRLHEITCPTLIISGSKDEAVPLHHAKMLHDGIRGSELVVLEGYDHGLIWAHPKEFEDVIDKFITT